MMSKIKKISCCIAIFFGVLGLMSCATTGETAQRDRVTENIDNFSSPPSGVDRLRVGVPPFETNDKDIFGYSVTGNELSQMAADQMTTLMFKTGRFRVIERAQMNQLLREQNLEGIVKDGELAKMGQVRGLDYMLLGKITNFRIKREDTSTDYGVGGRISRELLDGISGGFRKNTTRITTEVGVDIRLVDPESGEVKMAEFSEYERTDTADSMGLRVAGIGGSGNSAIQVGQDDAGQVLRLAFADALKKAMPQIDRVLIEDSRASGQVEGTSSTPAEPEAAAGFCGECGNKLQAGAKFCPSCGSKVSAGN
jgi:curli biogenesis system outer membrane secretion channel CsgG